jgi:hypothetical protein
MHQILLVLPVLPVLAGFEVYQDLRVLRQTQD